MKTLRSLTLATALFSSVCCVRTDTVVTCESPPTATANVFYVANRAPGEWLEMDFGWRTRFNLVAAHQSMPRITAYKIQAFANGDWLDIFSGDTQGQIEFSATFAPAEASKVRFFVVATSGRDPRNDTPSRFELEAFDTSTTTQIKP